MTIVNVVPVAVKGIGYADYAKAVADAIIAAASTLTFNVQLSSDIVIANVNISSQTANLGVDIKAQTVGNIGIDIKAQTLGVINVNLTSTSIVLNVNISSTTANIGVDIKAQTVGNVAVNIAAQAANVTISINAQTVGVSLIGDWSAQQVTDVTVSAQGSVAVGFGPTITYLVPAGKTFYLTTITGSVMDTGDNCSKLMQYYVTDGATALIFLGGYGGCGFSLNKPIRFATGHTVTAYVAVAGMWSGGAYFTLLGYLTTP